MDLGKWLGKCIDGAMGRNMGYVRWVSSVTFEKGVVCLCVMCTDKCQMSQFLLFYFGIWYFVKR